jgi:hypothetical protein
MAYKLDLWRKAMNTEIERRFLVKPEHLPHILRTGGTTLSQGYLSLDPVVRVRASETEAWITVKSRTTGISKQEYEYPIPVSDAWSMLELCQNKLTKTRRTLRLGNHGWEVENNTKAFYHLRTIDPNRANYQYKAFFHALGIPNVLNLIENDVGKDMTVEIASYPAYSARVASRLLSEYIKCGIIPSLRSSSDPGDIKKYLSDKLVSFHINLGVPLDFDSSEARRQKAEPQAAVLASSLSLGFSSPLRLRNKSSSFLSTWKYGQYEMVETSKTSLAKGRLELKALEVRDTSVYRLIAHSQLLGAAFFASFGTHIPHLAAEWRRFEDSINTLYNEFNIKPQQLSQKRQLSKALNMRKSPTDVLQALDIPSSRLPQFDSMNIQPFVRILLDDAARRIRKVIYRPSKTPLQTTKS